MMNDDVRQPDRQPAAEDTWLDSLLGQDASTSAHVDDAGFTASVVASLPARAGHSRYRWIIPAMGVLGAVIGLVWLSGGEELTFTLASIAYTKSAPLQALLVVGLPLALLYWLAVDLAWRER